MNVRQNWLSLGLMAVVGTQGCSWMLGFEEPFQWEETTRGSGASGGSGGIDNAGGMGASAGSSGTGGASGVAGSAGAGGAGGAIGECTVAADCQGADGDCQQRTCVAQVCGWSFTPSGEPLSCNRRAIARKSSVTAMARRLSKITTVTFQPTAMTAPLIPVWTERSYLHPRHWERLATRMGTMPAMEWAHVRSRLGWCVRVASNVPVRIALMAFVVSQTHAPLAAVVRPASVLVPE